MIVSVIFLFLILNVHDSHVAGQTCPAAPATDKCDVARMKKECPCKYTGNTSFKAYATVGKCLRIFHNADTWQDAQKICKKFGGKLYEANDRIELLPADKLPLQRDFWIGLNDIEKEGEWRWQLGSSSPAVLDKYPSIYVRPPAVRETFAPWRTGQPKNQENIDCVVMDKNGQWRVESCSMKLPYLCQIVSGHKPSPPVLTVGWTKSNHTLMGSKGSSFTAQCSGFVDEATELFIEAATAPPGLTRDISNPAGSTGTKNFLLDPNQKCARCGVQLTRSIQSAVVTVALLHSRLRCCTRSISGAAPTCRKYHTCAYSPIINIEYPAKSPDIHGGFTMEHGKAYIDHVLQGWCRGAAGSTGTMTLKFMRGEWEARADVDTIKSKGDDIDRITVERKPDILDKENGPLINILFRINVTKAMAGEEVTCATKANLYSKKFTASLVGIQPICAKPLAPVIKLNPFQQPNVLYSGFPMKTTCAAFIDATNNLAFKYISSGTTNVFTLTNKAVVFTDDPNYKATVNTCGRRVVAQLNTTILKTMEGSTFRCCAKTVESVQQCSTTDPVRVIYGPLKPKLKYTASGDKLSATCDAVVGASDGVLTWRVINKDDREFWTVDTQGHVAGRSDGDVTITSTSTKKDPQGHIINSTLELKVESEDDLKSVVVTCASYDILNGTRLWLDLQDTYSDSTIFKPKPPEFEVKYYKDYEDTVALGQQLESTCKAWVGTGGSLTWVLQLKDGQKKGEDYRVTIGPRGLRDEEIQIEGAQITYEYDETDEVNGPYIASNISVKVTRAMEGAQLMCYSYDGRSESLFLADEADTFWKSSFPLKVMAFPSKPELDVFYHGAPNIVYRWKILEATCSAGVGPNGTLSWVLNTFNTTTVWPINSYGELQFTTPDEIFIEADEAVDTEDIGPMIKSTIHILVESELQGAVLACYSYNVSTDDFDFEKEDELATRSLELYVLNPPVLHSKVGLRIVFSLLFLLLLLLAIIAEKTRRKISQKIRREPPPNESNAEGDDFIDAELSPSQAFNISKQVSSIPVGSQLVSTISFGGSPPGAASNMSIASVRGGAD